jgi:succinyl-CoA synthetase beta subunit
MEIEEVAEKTPEKILRVKINPALGLQPYQARKISYFLNCDDTQMRAASDLISNLYRVFTDNDATMVEINPLVITSDGQMLAVDAKLTLEDDALFRHTNFADFHDPDQEDPVEVRAREAGLSYVQLDGNVGCMVNGAGLAMATMDVAVAAGAKPANFLDVGGGADDTKVAEATRILLQSTSVEVILVNIFGGILRCDVVARGLMMGAESAGRNPLPMVVRMLGANAEEGQQLLKGSNLDVTLVRDLGQAADAVKQLV